MTKHTEIKKHLAAVRKEIVGDTTISEETRNKAIAKLDVIQSQIDEDKVTPQTRSSFLEFVDHLEHNPTLVELALEALPFLPQ